MNTATTALPQHSSPLQRTISKPDIADFAFGPLSTIFGNEPQDHSNEHQSEPHYEKYYTGSPKSGKDYRLLVEKMETLRRK